MFSDSTRRRVLTGIAAALIVAFLGFFTARSLWFYFDPDDMMNLYFAWSKPLRELLLANVFPGNSVFRPMGALFYRSVFAWAGFDPLPFRAVCLLIGLANLWLCYRFTRLITGKARAAALATLFFTFQSRLMEVWFRTAVIYDLLCFTFFYLAACLYVSARQADRFPGAGRIAAILALYVCALDSKEVAVALPLVLLGYEVLLKGASLRRSRDFLVIGLLACLNVPYIIGKTRGANAITNNPDYRPEYSFERFTESWSTFLDYIFLGSGQIKPWMAIAILALMLAIAVVFRSKLLIFAWMILFTATLPVAFLPYRGGFVLYISWVGWTMYAALAICALEDLITRSHPQYRTAVACIFFVLAGWRWGKANLHDQRADPRHWLYDPAAKVREMATQMSALHHTLPKGATALFLDDGFSTGEWTPYFIMKLLYRDDTMVVDRIKMMDRKPNDWSGYRYVFTYRAGNYLQVKP